jgi:hypothetical protein
MSDKHDEGMRFGGGGVTSVAGVLGGVAFAIGVPYIVLNFGQVLSPAMVTGVVIGALVIGGLVCLVSAFFGLVMPTHIPDEHGGHRRHFGDRDKTESGE